jgi:hypothetical protein
VVEEGCGCSISIITGELESGEIEEIPSITVAVIEAGGEVFDNPNVTNVDGFVGTAGR